MIIVAEMPKLWAFVRRDLRIALSYRTAFFTGLLGIFGQVVVFSLIGRLVNPTRMPVFGGTHVGYVEFAAVGICLNMAVVLLLHDLAQTLRSEQMLGTLESLLISPARMTTIQLGSSLFNLLYVPLRAALFLAAIALTFGLHLRAGGIAPAVVLMLLFVPLLWGAGLAAAGAILSFRRGAGAIGVGVTVLGLSSGAFIPISVLPGWLRSTAAFNPLATVLHGLRAALLGHAGWSQIAGVLPELAPLAVGGVLVGVVTFRIFLRRERRLGTLGLY